MTEAVSIIKDLSVEKMEEELKVLEERKAESVKELDNQIDALKVLIKAKRIMEEGKPKIKRQFKRKSKEETPIINEEETLTKEDQAKKIQSFLVANGPSAPLAISRGTSIHHQRVYSLLNDPIRFKCLSNGDYIAK